MSYLGAIRLQAFDDAQESRSWYGDDASAARVYAYSLNAPTTFSDPTGFRADGYSAFGGLDHFGATNGFGAPASETGGTYQGDHPDNYSPPETNAQRYAILYPGPYPTFTGPITPTQGAFEIGPGLGDMFGIHVVGAFDVAEGPQTPGYEAWKNFDPSVQFPALLLAQPINIQKTLDNILGFVTPLGMVARAESALAAIALKGQLLSEIAKTSFTETGELSAEALAGSREIIPSSQIGNPEVPDGYSKYSTDTFSSPSGDFQTHFYMNPETGETFYDRDYKSIFNKQRVGP